MRRLQHLRPAKGATSDSSRRGRGAGSGKGGTSGKGHKGQKARSSISPWFEGGQMPIQRRMSHKGFNNAKFAKNYQIVNVENLNRFRKDTVVTPELLKEAGLISSRFRPVKILGKGELKKSLTVCANAFSSSAAQMIESTGGAVEVLE
ncbi:MAG: 50S ribosomal protein L15 [Candidatus Aegiribacteria sp.]|nr:50S ribosomal protein L15 [Candidatus Aegiribacteria sp.]MBD3294603.1 50S ribosomal protein L15 [Candidatus Fermentibacteria bacterium]